MDLIMMIFRWAFILCPPILLFEFIGDLSDIFITVNNSRKATWIIYFVAAPVFFLCFVFSFNYPIIAFILAWTLYFNKKKLISRLSHFLKRTFLHI